jgi:hypothetical protein
MGYQKREVQRHWQENQWWNFIEFAFGIDFSIRYFFFFPRYWGLNSWLSPWATPPALFLCRVFEIKSHRTICLGWLWTMIFLISASWVVRIIGVSHWYPGSTRYLSALFYSHMCHWGQLPSMVDMLLLDEGIKKSWPYCFYLLTWKHSHSWRNLWNQWHWQERSDWSWPEMSVVLTLERLKGIDTWLKVVKRGE